MTTDATPAVLRLIDQLGPLVDKWAADEYVQFASRSDGQRTTATVSRDALILLADRVAAAARDRCASIARQVADGCADCDAHYIMELIEKA